MKRVLLLLPLLVACATPQQQCISQATREERVLDRLIIETETNLARGYGTERYTTYQTDWRPCYDDFMGPNGRIYSRSRMCVDDYPVTKTRPKAIDLDAEAAKLKQLKAKRASLSRSTQAIIRQCQASYPQ